MERDIQYLYFRLLTKVKAIAKGETIPNWTTANQFKLSNEQKEQLFFAPRSSEKRVKHPAPNGRTTKKLKAVNQNEEDGTFIKTWTSAGEVERGINVNGGHISLCCQGKRKSAGGFKWKFA